MAHFYGDVRGNRTTTSRLGSVKSGVQTHAAGWRGAVSTRIWHEDGVDKFAVYLTPWQGSGGTSHLLAEGILDADNYQEGTA